MNRSVALLRGVNVGGKNLVPMAALKAFFEAEGFEDVRTYIQSGNVLFSSSERGAALVERIEAGLSAAFGYRATVVVRSVAQLAKIVEGAPRGFGSRPALYRSDVLFLKEPLTPEAALALAPAKPGVDEVFAGPGVLYYSRLIAKASQSRMSRIVALPMYQQLTIRNWNTTTRLLELMREGPAGGARALGAGSGRRRGTPGPTR